MSVNRRYTLEKYIACPLTEADIASYMDRYQSSTKHAARVLVVVIFLCTLPSFGFVVCLKWLFAFLDLGGSPSIFTQIMLFMTIWALVLLKAFFLVGEWEKRKNPMSLEIAGDEYLVSGLAAFDEVEISSEHLALGSDAVRLINAIKEANRPICEFERRLMNSMVEL